MPAPLLSVRSAKARDLAYELARKEGRPIQAIVEDALVDYARRRPLESAAAFLQRMRALGEPGEGADLDAALNEHRRRPREIGL